MPELLERWGTSVRTPAGQGCPLGVESAACVALTHRYRFLQMSKKGGRRPGRNLRARLRLFDAGNTICPICLSKLRKSDVKTGRATLEHAPPRSRGGLGICLTCKPCNNNASRIDDQPVLAERAKEEWSSGLGARIEIDVFGFKTSSRYFPKDSNSPIPTRVTHLCNGTMKLDKLPSKEYLNIDDGIRFRIRTSSHYEHISMIKSAYLMVFSLMGEAGYGFAESLALEPVREQIMNPKRRILKRGFVVKGTMPKATTNEKRLVFLCHAARPPLWIIPMWNGNVVFLPCGGPEPIDEIVFPENEFTIENNQLTGWTTCRFDESARIAGSVSKECDIVDGSLVGSIGYVPTSGGEWEWIVVDHHNSRYVSLPFRSTGDPTPPSSINIVEMLNANTANGRGLIKYGLSQVDLRDWSKDLTISGISLSSPRD